MNTTEISVKVEELVEGDVIVAYTVFSMDSGERTITGTWTVQDVYEYSTPGMLLNIYTDRGVMPIRKGKEVRVRRTVETPAEPETVETVSEAPAVETRTVRTARVSLAEASRAQTLYGRGSIPASRSRTAALKAIYEALANGATEEQILNGLTAA